MSSDSTDSTKGHEAEYKLVVRDEGDFDALSRLLTGDPSSGRTEIQDNHFFDTEGGELRGSGHALRLRFEGARRVLTAKGPAERLVGALRQRPEDEADVDAADAERVLSGAVSALDLLVLGLAPERSPVVEAMERVIGDAPVGLVGSFRNVRRYVGPVMLGGRQVTFEMDRAEFPGGRIDHEVEIETDGADDPVFEAALRKLFDEAGIPWTTAPSKARRLFEALGQG